nr:hypothetical transcript [Hymenolepis microstoma]
MEPANADRITSTELRKNEESENDIHPPLSICYSEKSYEQCSPPVCYVELAGHKSTKDQQSLADSASEFPTEDGKIETADLDTLDGSSSTPRSVLIVKDGDNGECASIIPTPPQSVVPSSVVQDQRNATTTSVPGPLVDASLEPLSESRLVIVEKDSIDEEDIDERPLVVDL